MEGADCAKNAMPDSESKSKENAAVNNSGGGGEHSLVNGLSNGYNDKHKKERHKDKHKEKHRDSDRDKDRHRDKHKEHRDRDKEREREKEKDKDRHKHSSSSSSKDKEKDKSRHSSSSKDKDREKDKDRKDKDRSREKSSSSSSKDKEHKSSSSSKHSSSSSKDKDRHSSNKDKHSSDKHRSDKDRDRHKDSSNKDKEKDRHGSDKKERDKHKEKERSKEKPKEEKEGHRSISENHNVSKIKDEPLEQEALAKQDSSRSSYNDSKILLKEEVSIKEEVSEDDDDDDEGKMVIKEEADDSQDMIYEDQSSKNDSRGNSTFIKSEEEDDEDVPLMARTSKIKRELESDDEDDVPLMARKKTKKPNKKRKMEEESDEEDFKPAKKKKSIVKKEKRSIKVEATPESPKKKKKQEEEQEVWKWWEEEKKADGVKWNYLEHKGPMFAPDYERIPSSVKFFYDGEEMRLSEEAEEVATFYARMLDHDYTSKEAFNENFFKDWRKTMTDAEKERITKLSKCNFKQMHAYFTQKSEERKAMSKEEKKAIKEKNDEITKEYGFCTIDGHKEKIGNFKIEPPGLFRGRGEHPKMGKLKKRVLPEHVLINCSKDSKIPVPPKGHKWKEVRHDNTVTWLCSWTENVQGQVKYVMLNPSSKLKGEKDWQKYETARKLAKSIDKIREEYRADWKSKEMRIRQRAVAMYFIDKLALRAGNEKDEDQADTVGCCSLRVEHIQLHEEKDGKEYVVVFDFLGKDSIRYYNEVPVEKRVFKNLQLFVENKKGNDDLFDRLNTTVLNKYLNELMDGLSAKVFRTYNASWTLQQQLKELTDPDAVLAEKVLAYNRANRAVAVLCNHQRSIPKTHQKSMDNLKEKIANKKQLVDEAEKNYKYAKRDAKNGSAKEKIQMEKCKKTLDRLKEQLLKLEVQETDKEENKTIALGTSKLNYLDPRISVAWCKKFNVPIEKIYNKTQRDKFRWAIDMAGPDYIF